MIEFFKQNLDVTVRKKKGYVVVEEHIRNKPRKAKPDVMKAVSQYMKGEPPIKNGQEEIMERDQASNGGTIRDTG